MSKYKYYADRFVEINGKMYNPGDIIVSEKKIDNKNLKELNSPIKMSVNLPKSEISKYARKTKPKKKIADIIIPHHNRHDLLKNTLDKLPLDIFNIFVVAGGSFARNCNLGAKMAQTDNLVFMNDDIEPDVEQIIEACQNKADIVGFSEILPNEGGRIVRGIGWSKNLKANLMENARDVHIPNGFLFRVKKKAWEKLGGFDENFINGAEDLDLGLRAREMGMTIDYIYKRPIVHYHSQSEGRFDNVSRNRDYFQKLWPEERLRKALGFDKSTKKILITNHSLKNLAGTETFTYTLGKELERRGYEVDVFTFEPGIISDYFFTITPQNGNQLREEYDYIFINHNTCLDYILSKGIKGIKIFTSHGIYPKLEQPKKGADIYVAISEEVRNHLSNLGFDAKIIHNGIDCKRFKPKKPIRKKLKKVLSLCKDLDENFNDANDRIKAACDKMGIEFEKAKNIFNLEEKINEADLVVSLGRGAYEAMACGRAVLVFDKRHYMGKSRGDGIVTEENADELLKCNFSGRRYDLDLSVSDIINEFKKYDQSMGKFNRRYALKHFDIRKQVDKYFDLVEDLKKRRIEFVGSSQTEYGIAKQLEKKLIERGFSIGKGGIKICYANDLGMKDPVDGSMIILENRPTFKRALESNADHYFCKEKSCMKFFPKNTTYLPCGVDDKIFNEKNLKRDIDIGFVGKEMFSSRKKFIKFLKDAYGDRFVKKEGIFFEELAEFYNRCKIVPNQCPADDINMRLFEATACGALMITPYVPYLEELFDLGKEIVIYEDLYDLLDKINYYLKHEGERKKIAKAGQKRTLRDHTYDKRVDKIIEVLYGR